MADGTNRCAEAGTINFFKPFFLITAAVKTPYNTNALYRLLQHGGYISKAFLYHPPAGMQFSAEKLNHIRNQRHDDETKHGQLPLQINHRRKGADKNRAFLYKRNKIHHDGRLQRSNIISQITHDIPRTAAIIVGNRQNLQVMVENITDIHNNRLSDIPHQISMPESRERPDKESH